MCNIAIRVSAKLLIWIFAAVKMQIFSKHPFNHFRVQNHHFYHKMVIYRRKLNKKYSKNQKCFCIFTAVKNYNSTFANNFFDHDISTSSKIILNCTSIKTYFQNISNIGSVFIVFIFFLSWIFFKFKIKNIKMDISQ